MKDVDLPALQRSLAEAREAHGTVKASVAQHGRELEALKQSHKEAQELRADVEILKTQFDAHKRAKSEAEETSGMGSSMYLQSRTKEVIRAEQEEVRKEEGAKNRLIEDLQHQLQRRDQDLQQLRRKKEMKERDLAVIMGSVEKKEQLNEVKESLKPDKKQE